MGWESISMGLNAQGEVLNNSYWTSAPEDGAMLWPQFAEGNISGSMTFYASELQYGDSTNGLVYDDNGHILYVYYNGQQVAYFGLHAYNEWISYLIFFGINEENQVGSIWIAERRMTDRWGYTIAGGRVLAGSTTQIYNTNLAYNIIKKIMPLVGATIKVNYYLPSDQNYTYAKIVYKKDTRPDNEEDGESVTILKDESSIDISGLDVGSNYWFTIFTDKTQSESFPFTIGKFWDGSEIAILWSGNNNKLTAQISNDSILFKIYLGNTVIYSFTSQTGTSVSDISKINVGFLIDTKQEMAKPSFIYDIGNSSYKYNSESPTDAEMANIYIWLQAGI